MTEETTTEQPLEQALEDVFQEDVLGSAFQGGSIDGDAQLLEVASKHTLQLNGQQIRLLLYVDHIFELGKERFTPREHEAWQNFRENFIKYSSHNASQGFIGRVLELISLRRFINENTLKVNIDKNT